MTFYAIYGVEKDATAPALLYDFPQGKDTDDAMKAFVEDVVKQLKDDGVTQVRVEKHEGAAK